MVALATAALTLGLSGVALAGSTNLSDNVVTFNGDTGEQNNVQTGYDTISSGGPYIVVQEQNPRLPNNAGANCTNSNPNGFGTDPATVWCPAGGVITVALNGGDENDSLIASGFGYPGGGASGFFPPSVALLFNGGDGNDAITLPNATTTTGTGPTATANGDAGNDGITVFDGETGNGGDGDDTLRSGGTLAGEKTPFAIATLNGDGGNDSLNGAGNNTPDHLNGGEGDDVLFPGGGPEDLTGGNGNDAVNWANVGNGVNASFDNVSNDGRPGQNANNHSDIETLLGTPGFTDVLTGAPGVANFVDGFGGNDTFNVASNPADPDIVVCGDGFVTINADARDVFDTVGPTACRGQINKPATGAAGPTLKIRSGSTKIDSDGQVSVKVGCRGAGRCRGILELDSGSNVLGTAQFVVSNGQTKKVAVLPRPAYAKRLKSGKSVKVSATADATDSGGATSTTTRNITVKGKKHKK